MQFLTSLFGGFETSIVTAALALGIVLVLIVLALWVMKAFFNASSNLTRGRSRRLNVIDSVTLDPRRRVFIVRRDNVEHVILTGGPQDVVLETGIAAEKAAPLPRRPVPASVAAAVAAMPEKPASTLDTAPDAQSLVSTDAAVTGNPMERLRELARPVPRSGPSLRHTALLRPVSRLEPAAVIPMNPDAMDHRRIDSAKAGPANDSGGQRFGAGGYPADGYKAEGK